MLAVRLPHNNLQVVYNDQDKEQMSRADIIRIVDNNDNRGGWIEDEYGPRIDFRNGVLEIGDDLDDQFAYGKRLMSTWNLYCALTSGSFITLMYFFMDLMSPLKDLSLVFQRDSLGFADIAVNVRKARRSLRKLRGNFKS